MRRIVSLALLGALTLPAAAAASADEASLTDPLLAIGGFMLGAVDAGCLAPGALTAASAFEGARPPTGLLVAGYVCGAIQVGGGLAYALRDDGPGWQRTIGAVSVGLGAVNLAAAVVGSALPPVEVAGARLRLGPALIGPPGERAWGLALSGG